MLSNRAVQMISRVVVLLISLLFVGCAAPQESNGDVTKEVSIAYLKSLCGGSHHRISSDYRLTATVVANGWLGEFHKSIVVEDKTAGIEIAIDLHDTGDVLPIYSRVEVMCNGLMLARVGGKVELGVPSDGEFPIDNISADRVAHHIRIVGTNEEYEPITRSFRDISVADISRAVRIDDVVVCAEEQGLAWCDEVEGEVVTTDRTLVDEHGDTFVVRTLSTCDYALNEMPTKKFSVVGIVDYADDRYFLRIINHMII